MDHLHKIYDGFIYSIANNDKEFLSEYVEDRFYHKLSDQIDRLIKEGYSFTVEK